MVFKPFASAIARGFRTKSLLSLGLLLLIIFFGIISAESIRYFDSEMRWFLLRIFIGIGLFGAASIAILTQLLSNQKLKSTTSISITKALSEKLHEGGQIILQGFHLSNDPMQAGISVELKDIAIQNALSQLQQVDAHILYPEFRIKILKKRFTLVSGALLILALIFFQPISLAFTRVMHPFTVFEYPMPVIIKIQADDYDVLAGDTIHVSGQILGREAQSVHLLIDSKNHHNDKIIRVRDSNYEMILPRVQESFSVIASSKMAYFWEPWTWARSDIISVHVLNRPVVSSMETTIIPPKYTGLEIQISTDNARKISTLPGSKIEIRGKSTKALSRAVVQFQTKSDIACDVKSDVFFANWTIHQSDNFKLNIFDDDSIPNLNPLEYLVYIDEDAAPYIKIILPAMDVLLGDNAQLPLRLKIGDDFGFSKLLLNYRILKPDYFEPDSTVYKSNIKIPSDSKTAAEFDWNWDLSELNLIPEWGVEYWFQIYDNNNVSGYSMAKSKVYSARLPSMLEMFEQTDAKEKEIRQDTESVLESVKDIKEKIDQLAMEVKKDQQLDWNQQQDAQNAMADMKALEQQLEAISEELDKMIQESQEQNLFDDETLNQFEELQKMFENLMTQELKEAMRNLQDAMEENNPQAMENAMSEFQQSMDEFKKSLERTLELFKQVEMEQKMDELSSRMAEMAKQQEELLNSMDENSPETTAALEENIEKAFEQAQKVAEELKELAEENENLDTSQLDELQSEMSESGAKEDLSEATDQFKEGNMEAGKPSAKSAQKKLQKMAQQAGQMQQGMQQQMMEQVMGEFRKILMKTLSLSQRQEALESETKKARSTSSTLRDYADDQYDLTRNIQQIAAELSDLGNETFAVSGKSAKQLGKALSAMQEAISEMESRRPGQAAGQQKGARQALNQLAQDLASSMQSLEEGGQASGFQQYMESLQKMAGQQQGLNQETMMQMGQGNQSMMQQMARRQSALRDQLGQIEQGMGNDGRMLGDLGKIGEEMEAVAKELNAKRPNKKVVEQQERILSKLLDAQRSAHQRDFSKKRKSETASEINNSSLRIELPDDLGEKRNILYEELIYSLKQSYTPEERALIQQYFQLLEEMETPLAP